VKSEVSIETSKKPFVVPACARKVSIESSSSNSDCVVGGENRLVSLESAALSSAPTADSSIPLAISRNSALLLLTRNVHLESY
jgi:hypothetical protein